MLVHESPAHAKVWALPEMRNMVRRLDVHVVEAGQCMYGLRTWGNNRASFVRAKKPTNIMPGSGPTGR